MGTAQRQGQASRRRAGAEPGREAARATGARRARPARARATRPAGPGSTGPRQGSKDNKAKANRAKASSRQGQQAGQQGRDKVSKAKVASKVASKDNRARDSRAGRQQMRPGSAGWSGRPAGWPDRRPRRTKRRSLGRRWRDMASIDPAMAFRTSRVRSTMPRSSRRIVRASANCNSSGRACRTTRTWRERSRRHCAKSSVGIHRSTPAMMR